MRQAGRLTVPMLDEEILVPSPMSELLFSPITDEKKAEPLLKDLPLAVDKEHFVNFVLGFPHHYLMSAHRVETVKYHLLGEGLADKQVISSPVTTVFSLHE